MALHLDTVPDRPAIDPADEIEVTPEMVRAGVDVLNLSFSSDGFLDERECVVEDVFRAMMLAVYPLGRRV